MKNGDFPLLWDSSPEGTQWFNRYVEGHALNAVFKGPSHGRRPFRWIEAGFEWISQLVDAGGL